MPLVFHFVLFYVPWNFRMTIKTLFEQDFESRIQQYVVF